MFLVCWFFGVMLNFVEYLLCCCDDVLVLIVVSEDGCCEVFSYVELVCYVVGLQKCFVVLGIGFGDWVVVLMLNIWQIVVGMFVIVSFGVIWLSCLLDFGIQGVIDCFGQIELCVLIVCVGYCYVGKLLDLIVKFNEVFVGLFGLE